MEFRAVETNKTQSKPD